MARTRGPVHRAVRRIPGVQALYGELRLQLALRRRTVTLDHRGSNVRIRVPTRSIARLRVHPVEKEPWTVRWIEENLQPGDVLWDVGANVGSYALIAARIERRARVVAVEPGYANYAALCENVLLNRLGERVVALPLALAESSRLGELSLTELEPGAAIHRLDAERPGPHVQAVLVFGLDDLVERFGVPAPTLVKVDVDGAEPAVLAGGAGVLARSELRSVLVEIDEENGDRVVEALGAAGLTLADRIEERDGVPLPGVWYGVFTR